ncbi:hypothetical protein CO046_01970 [Candidatus Peregrinibacteria bacterium CG_4_9_14_0_2_um_filter_53_11]|nr:MAG: hypothetical protein CO046_01970 [Candidatus Peregrinibacteria bacterium CG_4_9_14_0_2_um_filter_53_11]
MRPTSFDSALRATLTYFGLMGLALRPDEVAQYLYGWDATPTLSQVVQEMARLPEIVESSGFYTLRGAESLVEYRRAAAPLVRERWRKVRRFGGLFSALPFVRMVAVVNSLAHGLASPKSDIDLFVVVEDGRMDEARFWFKALTQLCGVRVHHNKRAGRFCLSFFVTQRSLDLREVALPFDPHLASMIVTAQPVCGAEQFDEWRKANAHWVADYFPTAVALWNRPDQREKTLALTGESRRPRSLAAPHFTRLIELLSVRPLGGLNYKRDARYVGRVSQTETASYIWTADVVKFHERDRRKFLAESFRKAFSD